MSEAAETSTTRRGALGHVLGAAFTVPLVATMCVTADAELIALGEKLAKLRINLETIRAEAAPVYRRRQLEWAKARSALPLFADDDMPLEVLREVDTRVGSQKMIKRVDAASAEVEKVVAEIEARPWTTPAGLVVWLRAVAFMTSMDDQFGSREVDMDGDRAAMFRLIQQAERIAAAA